MPQKAKVKSGKTSPRKSAATSKRVSLAKTQSKKNSSSVSKKSVTTLASTQTMSYKEAASAYAKNPRFWVGVGVVVLAVVLYVYKGLFIAATVNGQPILRTSVISQLEQQSGKQALNNLVLESLVFQEAQKRNVTAKQSDIDAQVSKIETTLKTQGTTLDSALASQGLTKSDLLDQIKLQILLDKMVGSNAQVSDADVQNYIDKNKDSLPTDMSDSDLKNQVRSQLQQQTTQTKTQAFLADLQKKAQIQYYVNY